MPALGPDEFIRVATLFVPEQVAAVEVSPLGDYLAIAAGDKLHIHAYSAAAGATATDYPRLVTVEMPDKITSISFAPDGKTIIAAIADKVHVYRLPK